MVAVTGTERSLEMEGRFGCGWATCQKGPTGVWASGPLGLAPEPPAVRLAFSSAERGSGDGGRGPWWRFVGPAPGPPPG
eukprot:CAMPEP_0119485040 /NCGR_PEP_ID=MMETSP1344-20130328/11872_1 /TAXON_ID=236787 /ORGANISM="Florenciella parvula, Strain CCMP2471" /LENGTH=78 /DNA_ID=CAMNT_0007519677 /DNA_START=78 /DNA_END=310 /DNA_ORIENTATION=+